LADAFNFGPGAFANRTVAVLVEEILRHWPGEWRDASDPAAPAEASRLNLATDKATYWLGWFSTWDFPEAVEQTLAWYYQRHLANNPAMLEFSRAQIELFGRAAQAKGLAWANTAPL
jgi:CDP-glucose 4,6-dehydratase